MLAWFVIGGLGGCRSAAPDVEADVPVEALGWVAEVVRNPASFGELVNEGRDGWVALHGHDYVAARRAFAGLPVGRFRAELALTTLDHDVARVIGFGTRELFTAWKARGSLPEGPSAPLVAALGASCSGEDPTAWATAVTEGPDLRVARHLAAGGDPFDAPASDTPVGRRLALHAAVRSGERPAADLVDAAAEPLIVEQAGDFRREFWDPCVAATLATRHLADASSTATSLGGADTLSEAGLGARLFAAWPTTADIDLVVNDPDRTDAERLLALGTRSTLLARLGHLPPDEGDEGDDNDEIDAARDWLRRLDGALDHWADRLTRTADDDGRALLVDLGLVSRLRQEVVIVQAREAMRQGRFGQAWALLEQARDPSEGLGPANAPALYALLAEAHLRLGRTREAMDAVQPLVEAYPWLEGTRETLGDWAVLQGLDRRGDSKENP